MKFIEGDAHSYHDLPAESVQPASGDAKKGALGRSDSGMKATVYIDQAVWERQTLEIEVPDRVQGEDLADALHDAIGCGNYKERGVKTLNPLDGCDAKYALLLPGGDLKEF